MPVDMAHHTAQMLDIPLKTQRHTLSGSQIHGSLV